MCQPLLYIWRKNNIGVDQVVSALSDPLVPRIPHFPVRIYGFGGPCFLRHNWTIALHKLLPEAARDLPRAAPTGPPTAPVDFEPTALSALNDMVNWTMHDIVRKATPIW
jgi:hypothetical protein